MDSAFISRGFTGWKDACAAFRKHEVSESHRAAMETVVVQSDPTYPDVVVAGTPVYRAPSARSAARSTAHAHYRPTSNLASLLDLEEWPL